MKSCRGRYFPSSRVTWRCPIRNHTGVNQKSTNYCGVETRIFLNKIIINWIEMNGRSNRFTLCPCIWSVLPRQWPREMDFQFFLLPEWREYPKSEQTYVFATVSIPSTPSEARNCGPSYQKIEWLDTSSKTVQSLRWRKSGDERCQLTA